MTKRNDGYYIRKPRDFYPTPYAAVLPLLQYLPENVDFIEPFAGDGRLIDHLSRNGHECVLASDIEPLRGDIHKCDFLNMTKEALTSGSMIITNPPWRRDLLHPALDRIIECGTPAWILLDADWAHTTQAVPYLKYCSKIVAIGRVKWIEESKSQGFDNCCWYQFIGGSEQETIFKGKYLEAKRD